MADYSIDIQNKYVIKTYKDAKNTYEWIIKSIEKSKERDKKYRIDSEFLFCISKITCKCRSIEEFIENAYNQEGFSLYRIDMYLYENDNMILDIHSKTNIISLSSKSKQILEKYSNLLETTNLEEKETSDISSITYIEKQDNSINVNGNNNATIRGDNDVIVGGDKNRFSIKQKNTNSKSEEKEPSKFKQWLTAVGQNLLANGIWYILTFLAGLWLAYFVAK